MAKKLEGVQKERATRLECQLEIAYKNVELGAAKVIIQDLQDIYVRFGQTTLYGIAKNKLYEIAIEAGNLEFAESGLLGLRQKFNKRTRMYLEATVLLAICYIRKDDINKAEPLITEVLKNEHVIKSEAKRSEFYKSVIERFDEEATLRAIRNTNTEQLNSDEILKIADGESKRNTEDLFINIGMGVPNYAKNVLFKIDTYSKNQLPTAERLKLPSPKQIIEDDKLGKTVFSSIKRVLYKSLCDKESDIYKSWFNNGLGIILDKRFITGVIIESCIKIGIGLKAILIPIVALVLKFGIEVYCEKYKPSDLMGLR